MSSARARRSTRPGTILDPDVWWDALLLAVERAGGLEDVAAVSVSGQQHTPVFLDASGAAVGCATPTPTLPSAPPPSPWSTTG